MKIFNDWLVAWDIYDVTSHLRSLFPVQSNTPYGVVSWWVWILEKNPLYSCFYLSILSNIGIKRGIHLTFESCELTVTVPSAQFNGKEVGPRQPKCTCTMKLAYGWLAGRRNGHITCSWSGIQAVLPCQMGGNYSKADLFSSPLMLKCIGQPTLRFSDALMLATLRAC